MFRMHRPWLILLVSGTAMAAPPTPDADDFVEDFESYVTHVSLASSADFVRLAGQVGPSGIAWKTSSVTSDYSGVVNNAIAQSGPNWNPSGTGYGRHGVTGGPDPTGAHGQFLAHPRGSIAPQAANTNHAWVGRLNHGYYAPTATTPLVIAVDMYFDDLSTLGWFRPFGVSNLVNNIFVGGVPTQCPGGGDACREKLDTVRALGPIAGDETSGAYFDNLGLTIEEDEWFTLAIRLTWDGCSVWVRNAETEGANASGMPYDAPGMEGEIFDTGWAQVFPGIEDDPMTATIEGPGRATPEEFGSTHEPALILDSSGVLASPAFFENTSYRVEFVGDFDPSPFSEPSFEPHDWYVDNYMVLGAPMCLPDPSYSIPQVIDGQDLAVLLADWGTAEGRSDFDEDGVVNGADLAALLARWGACQTE